MPGVGHLRPPANLIKGIICVYQPKALVFYQREWGRGDCQLPDAACYYPFRYAHRPWFRFVRTVYPRGKKHHVFFFHGAGAAVNRRSLTCALFSNA